MRGTFLREFGGRGIRATGHFSSQKKEAQRFSRRHEPVPGEELNRQDEEEMVVGDNFMGYWTG